MSPPLRFGTDGWRGVIADTFTFENLDRMSQATAEVVGEREAAPTVVIGHDRRFMANLHADRVGEVMAGNSVRVIRTRGDAPTPAVSGLVVDLQASAGIVITASHNPAIYSGFKLKTAQGASAPGSLTGAVEARLDASPPRRLSQEEAHRRGLWSSVDSRPGYLRRLASRVDLPLLARVQPLTVVVDAMHGVAGTLLAEFLAPTSHRVITLRPERDVLFGGGAPEPVPERLELLKAEVRAHGADLGLATDGDGDRVSAVDETGTDVLPLLIAPLLAEDLIRRRGERGTLARTCANTVLLERIATAHGLPCRTFPIGFRHLVPLMLTGELLLGGEESGGIGVRGYLPERDGILAGLLLLEARAAAGEPLSSMIRGLRARHGELHYRRLDIPLATSPAAAAAVRLARAHPVRLAGLEVTGVEELDGTRLLLGEAGWVMARASGTEPVLRLYCEARSPREVDAILGATAATLGLGPIPGRGVTGG